MNLPNRLTLLRILAVPVVVVCYGLPFAWAHLLCAVVFVLAALTDCIDGYLARKLGQVTTFGKLIDPIADKLLVMTLLILLCADGALPAVFVVVMVARELIVSGVRMVAADAGTVVAASWLGKTKTVVQIVAVVLLLLGNFPFSLVHFPMDKIVLWAALIVTVWSGADYVWAYRRIWGETK